MRTSDVFRCPQCRTRRKDAHLMALHELQCPRPACHCGSYAHPHRPLSGLCTLNPDAQVALAARAGTPQEDLLDVAIAVAWSMPGKPMRAWPFDKHGVFAMREAQIEKHLVQRVKALGGEVRKVKWIGRTGAPDRLVMLPEKFDRWQTAMWVELKNPDTIRTFPADARERAQAREHKRMRDMGQRVEVIGTIEQVEALLA
jgi:hypothetical protein